ncbi:hypothetical protein [Bradyrhizobium sp. CCBAU 45389]|uniref:hypothetical protein n=1 Tax=Bradyrhizobium sp. CCBAU 45389 TaxID=858429 RepID=UPI002306A48A|nr:hypothetical protein [Bradyrhizobium sp. CCBAU 45389]
MSRVDEPTVSEIDRLIAAIVDLAGDNLISLSDPSLDFVPDGVRAGIATIHQRLKAEVRALLELRTVYGDLVACQVLARGYPWARGELSHYQHLRLAWSQLTRLSGTYDQLILEIDRLHNETLDLLSVDVEREIPPSDGGSTRRTEVVDRRARWDRWYEVAPQSGPSIFESMRVASEWSDVARPFSDYYDTARRELLGQIDVMMRTVATGIADFLAKHRDELTDLIGRYNDMIGNFRALHGRT